MNSTVTDHYSGVLVITLPGCFDACIEALEGEPGITVSMHDASRSRMIVVLEAPSRDGLEDLHRRVRALPGVVTADPVVHYVDDGSRNLHLDA